MGKVIIVRNSKDVKGLTRIGQVSQSTSKVFGKEVKLRDETYQRVIITL